MHAMVEIPSLQTVEAASGRFRTRRDATSIRRRGAVLVEAALVLPVVLLLILGVMEYGRFLMTLHLFNNAAREGCRYAVTHTQPVVLGGVTYGNATSDVTNVVTQMLAGQTLANQSIQVYGSDTLGNNTGTWNSVSAEQSVTVQITGNYQVTVPTLLGLSSTIPVNIKVAMRVEGN
jgi:Flp pilus assembly protein TadG